VSSALRSIYVDIAFGDSGVRRGIIDAISATYPGLYSSDNVALVGTHSHAGVGGYFESLLPQLTSLGYVNESAQAIIDGSVLAVQRAHASLAPGTLGVGNTTVLDGNANRSPSAYVANPAAERAQYEHDTDKVMTVLR
jgi:neutral ceramidase